MWTRILKDENILQWCVSIIYFFIFIIYTHFNTECDGADPAKAFFFVIFCIVFGLVLSVFPLPSTHTISSLIYYLNGVAILGEYLYFYSYFYTNKRRFYNLRYNYHFALIPLVQFNVDYWPNGCFGQLNYFDKFFIGFIVPLFFILPISVSKVGHRLISKSSRLNKTLLGKVSRFFFFSIDFLYLDLNSL